MTIYQPNPVEETAGNTTPENNYWMSNNVHQSIVCMGSTFHKERLTWEWIRGPKGVGSWGISWNTGNSTCTEKPIEVAKTKYPNMKLRIPAGCPIPLDPIIPFLRWGKSTYLKSFFRVLSQFCPVCEGLDSQLIDQAIYILVRVPEPYKFRR